MKKISTLVLVLAAVAFVGCGKAEEKKDDVTKKDAAPAKLASLEGLWQTKCVKGAKKTVEIKGDKYVYKKLKFAKEDCTGKVEVVSSEESKITVEASKVKGFTHSVTYTDLEFATQVSVGANGLKCEGESDLYVRAAPVLAAPKPVVEPKKK